MQILTIKVKIKKKKTIRIRNTIEYTYMSLVYTKMPSQAPIV